MPAQKLNESVILAAIDGFEFQKSRIDQQISELKAMLSGGITHPATVETAAGSKRKKFSAAVRRKMALGQKARWAKLKGESEPPLVMTPEPTKAKRKLSKAGQAAIVAATKARWDRVRADAAKANPAAKKSGAKKTAVKAAKTSPPAKKAAVKRKLSPARKAALVANLAKARAAKAAKATAGAQ
jgi:hypothetical protein